VDGRPVGMSAPWHALTDARRYARTDGRTSGKHSASGRKYMIVGRVLKTAVGGSVYSRVVNVLDSGAEGPGSSHSRDAVG